jgi:hypothetical protein
MTRIPRSWEGWRVVSAVRREQALPSLREHTDELEQQLERHRLDQLLVRLTHTDGVLLRSYNWARLQLGLPWAPVPR